MTSFMRQGLILEKETPIPEMIQSSNITVYGEQESRKTEAAATKKNTIPKIEHVNYFDGEDDKMSYQSKRSSRHAKSASAISGGDDDLFDSDHRLRYSSNKKQHSSADTDDERLASILEDTRKWGKRNYRVPYEMTNEIMKGKIQSMRLYNKITRDLRRGATEREIKRRRALHLSREKDRERSRVARETIEKVDECYIGDMVQHVEKMVCYIQPEIAQHKGVLTILPHRLVPKNKPAVECFGSCDKYHQGFDVLPQKKLCGDTENIFLVRVRVCDVKNNTGYAIGIKLAKGAKTERSTVNGVLYDLTPLKSEQHYHAGTGDRYHYISRPGENGRCENKEIIYKSDQSVNSAFSVRYPEITAKKSDYTMDGKLMSYGEFFKVPKLSPIIHLMYELKPFYPQWEYPREFKSVSGKPDKTAVLVNKSQFYEALERIIEQVNSNTTITDLSDLIFSFTVIEPDHGLEKDISSLYTHKEKKEQIMVDPSRIRNDIVPFCFTVEFTYYFREISGNDHDKVEDIIKTFSNKISLSDMQQQQGEEEEEQDDDNDDDEEGEEVSMVKQKEDTDDSEESEEEEEENKKKKKKSSASVISDTSSSGSPDISSSEEEDEEEENKKKKQKKKKDKKIKSLKRV